MKKKKRRLDLLWICSKVNNAWREPQFSQQNVHLIYYVSDIISLYIICLLQLIQNMTSLRAGPRVENMIREPGNFHHIEITAFLFQNLHNRTLSTWLNVGQFSTILDFHFIIYITVKGICAKGFNFVRVDHQKLGLKNLRVEANLKNCFDIQGNLRTETSRAHLFNLNLSRDLLCFAFEKTLNETWAQRSFC